MNFVPVDGDDGAPRPGSRNGIQTQLVHGTIAPRESSPSEIDSSVNEFTKIKYEANDANIEPIASQPSQIPTSENGAS